MTAPYLRIAEDIRRRITSGELRPGDRVPSTRALMRTHGVAMATATKALGALQQEGLVHPRPGIGTVVGPPPRPARPPRDAVPQLNREQLVRAAIAIADTEGLAAVSMRRIATDLGVSTMALYRYVGGKEALVLQMVDTAIGDFPFPARPPVGWREAIETAARLQWAAYQRHRWLAGAITLSRPQVLRNLLPHTDVVLRALAGLDPSTALYVAITVFGFVRGAGLNLEAEAVAEQDTGMTADEWAEHQAEQLATMIAGEGLRGFQAIALPGGFDFDYDLDQLFEFGLQLVLDGLAARLRTGSPPLR